MNEIVEMKGLKLVSEMKWWRGYMVGTKPTFTQLFPVASLLVKNKVCPTRRQLNIAPALLVSYFSITSRALRCLTPPTQSLTAMKQASQANDAQGGLRDKSTLGKVEGLQNWNKNSVLLVPEKVDCGLFSKESCFKQPQQAEIFVLCFKGSKNP